MLEKQLRHWGGWPWVIGLLALGLGLPVGAYFGAEWLWFLDVGHSDAFRLRMGSQIILALLGSGLSLVLLGGNLALAYRLPPVIASDLSASPSSRSHFSTPSGSAPRPLKRVGLGLGSLLGLALTLSLLISLQLLYLGQVFVSYWSLTASVYNPTPPLPLWAKPAAIQALAQQLLAQPWQLFALAVGAIALLLLPRFSLIVAALFTSAGLGGIMAEQWTKVLPALNPVSFQRLDPLFGRDIGFYVFQLPCLEVLQFWGISLIFFALVSVTLVYLLSGNSLSQGRFLGFTPTQQRHLYGLGGLLLLGTSFNHWLGRYQTLYSQRGVVYGASYTDVHVSLPVYALLSLMALLLGLGLLWRTLFWAVNPRSLLDWLQAIGSRRYAQPPPLPYRPLSARPLIWGIALYGLLALVGTLVVPPLVQGLGVQPNELQRETPYLERAIAQTREAFELNTIDVQPFVPEGELTVDDLQRNRLTIDNIRLWDTRPLLESNRQLQQIRLYYEFADADVDRYSLLEEDGTVTRRQVLIAARELNYERVPVEAQTWVNEHLVYTHGYGFTMSPVNIADDDGLPTYFIKDIAHTPTGPEADAVRRSIPLGSPRLYFGELTKNHIMIQTRVRELDYPSGSENVYTTYTGRSGIALNTLWRRLLFAWHLQDWRMVVTDDFTPQTRLLFRRPIMDRVRAIAPFLRFDQNPYLVVTDIQEDTATWNRDRPINQANADTDADSDPNHLYWMLDAYTTSDRYPYSDSLGNDFNYIRNSVKVVIDAYHGTVRFYIADPDDPVIQTWSRLLPGMFYPLNTMPPALREHIRYPQDLYEVQSHQLMTYHMTDPQVFYNREDQWREPNEIYASEARRVEPYYLIMKLPEEEEEEFILLRPFTPAQRNNLVAWLAARSDGDRYGSMLLYRFPKEELVFGPEQIEARINQDPEISQRISLWDTQGSRSIQGNLLVIPIERSLLYVEPIYLEAEQTSLPSLARVVLVYRNRIAMAQNLQGALDAIFLRDRPVAPPVLRELGVGDPEGLPGLSPDIPAE
ncbi:UPF0182 family protein [Leptolyngbya sp. PCC 6406]|uniref:UPF0182 family protein n=1 Tax=Leptolyngbya sp. PCC 6406 TaxID=1173264 RepID=UPI0002AC8D7F|nr:UPF0182 family protein [Leptolyngbya sp. PCC 6406]